MVMTISPVAIRFCCSASRRPPPIPAEEAPIALWSPAREVSLDRPVLVLGMEGWIDAGLGGTGAVSALLAGLDTELVGTFDIDPLLDHRSRRPVMRIVDGINTGLRWPEIQVRAGRDAAGNDMVMLVGPEPDHLWGQFTTEVVELASGLGVRLAVGLGAFPSPVPHTRPVQLSSTATVEDLAAKVGFVYGAIEVPAGIHAALERGFADVDIPAVGIWARVPHYVAGMPYPAASVALIEALGEMADLDLDPGELRAAAEVTRERIDELIARSQEHQSMVMALEAQADEEEGDRPLRIDNLPSGDELAEELQRFLRGESG
jgi:predicted ATP-grasp superfamily ATP-dependent carboligase